MKVLYTGSFDPVTVGHMDVIARANALFDHVIVAVLVNPDKQGFLSVEERVEALKACCEGMDHVKIVSSGGMAADLALQTGVDAIIRGIRDTGDVPSEMTMAHVNRALSGVETIFLPADSEKSFVSSSIVRQLIAFHGDYGRFLPEKAAKIIEKKLKMS